MAKIKVIGMSCQHCVNHVTNALQIIPGVTNVKVDLQSGEVSFDKPDSVTMDQIANAVKEAGYEIG